MPKILKPYSTLVDFVTGREVPNIGAEENRQAVERFLVEQKGYARADIEVDAEIALKIRGETYRSRLDLVVAVDGRRFMVVKCAAGSLGSWERQTLAAARLLEQYHIPLAVVSDGKTATVADSVSGNVIGKELSSIPSRAQAFQRLESTGLQALPEERREREMLIFRTYDQEGVNVQRNVTPSS
jgi:pyruvate/2-oxoacid:ferredoxin oxidoreductase alpha subunit